MLTDTVSVIDACTLKVIDTLSTENNPFGITYDSVNNRVYVTNQASDTVSVIDAATLEVIDTVPVGDNPNGITYDSVNNRAYLNNSK